MAYKQYDVAIHGGGMVGMSMALSLAQGGVNVLLIEKTPIITQLESHFDGRVSAIALGSKYLLEGIGAWEYLADQAEPILDIRVSDGNTPLFLHYDHQEVGTAPFGYIVENRYIRQALYEAIHKFEHATLIDQATLQRFEADEGGITLYLGQDTLRCRLLIGADGKHSMIRQQAGIKAIEWGYGQTAIVCTIEHALSHAGLAQERFLPAGPFAVLPMTGHRSSLVWVEPEDRVSLYLELSDSDFIQEIRERVGDCLGDITKAGQRFSYPLSLMHAKTYIGNRLALIGDAAHAIHPIAGQGVNLGFRDVAALSQLIIDRFRLGLDVGGASLLNEYQRWRRFDNVTMLAVTDGLNRLFSAKLLPLKLARELGLWSVSKMPPVKRFFMRHAMGLVGDLPQIVNSKRHSS